MRILAHRNSNLKICLRIRVWLQNWCTKFRAQKWSKQVSKRKPTLRWVFHKQEESEEQQQQPVRHVLTGARTRAHISYGVVIASGPRMHWLSAAQASRLLQGHRRPSFGLPCTLFPLSLWLLSPPSPVREIT